jgi:hypothetical protein
LRTDSALETPAGDIILYLSSDVHATVRAAIEVAQGHRITSDFPEIRITSEGGDWGPKTYIAEGRINGGGPVLKIRTTTGNIELRRLNHYWQCWRFYCPVRRPSLSRPGRHPAPRVSASGRMPVPALTWVWTSMTSRRIG